MTVAVADPTTEYARRVVDGEVIAGPHVREACARHLRDLEDGEARGLRFNQDEAARALEFFPAVLRLAGGRHEGKRFEPLDWERFIIGSLFGWQAWSDEHDGWFRRFRVAFIETAKGSGKSPTAAGIGIYMLVADDEPRAEVYAAAVKKDQAMVLFRDAVAMVDQSPALSARIKKSGSAGQEYNLAYLETASFFKPLSTEDRGRGQSGPRPHGALLDEVHEHRTNAMVEFMKAGQKDKRQPLLLMITNSGVDRQSVCFEYHTYATKVAAGQVDDDSFFGYVCAVDEDEDPIHDELDPELGYPQSWAKANPSLAHGLPSLKYLRDQVTQAKGMPAKESIVRRLNFCQWVDAENPWIDGDVWRSAEVEGLDIAALSDRPCYLALDLSSKLDLTAMAAVWPDEDGTYDAAAWAWTPKDTLLHREQRDQAPYGAWVEAGHLIAVPGRIIDYRYVVEQVAELGEDHALVGLAFDQWKIEDFQRALLEHVGIDCWIGQRVDDPEAPFEWIERDSGSPGVGLLMVRHGQGTGGGGSKHKSLWMPDSISKLEELLVTGSLRVRKNPVLTWASASAVLYSDPAGNRKWEKRKSTGRIDTIVALCMAIGFATSAPDVHEIDDGPVFTMLGE